MKVRTFFILILILISVLIARRVLAADTDWNARMQGMAAAVTCLAPLVASEEQFNDIKNHLQINSCVDDLWAQTKDLKDALTKHASAHSSDALMQKDPMLPYMASSFADDVEMAHQLVNSSNGSAYAQHLLRGTLTYCAACHTRKEESASAKFPVFADLTKGLSVTDRMKLLAATRNFDQALEIFDQAVRDPKTEKMSSLEMERAARLALSIAVRVEQSNAKALKLIDQIEGLKNLAPAFKEELATWKSGLKAEETLPSGSPLEKAKTLIQKAEATHDGLKIRVPQIAYLKASSLLHAYLATNPSAHDRAEALYYLANCYEHLENLGYWSMSEIYYEACIRGAPHSDIAARCLIPYKDSVAIGYSGKSGISMPANVQSNIRELETLAKPKKSNLKK